MRIVKLAALFATLAAMAVAASPASAGTGIRDRGVVLQPGLCASSFENSLNQFMYLDTNSPIKWSGGVRSCSTSDETVHVHFEQIDPGTTACPVAGWDTDSVTLRAGETKGLSSQAPEPTCEGYFFFNVTVVDSNGVNAYPGTGTLTYTVHVAPKV